MKSALAIAPVLLLALSACASAPGGREFERAQLQPIGDPGRVAAADIAFARAARDEGQWTAFRRFAASDAVMHGANGPVPAASWLEGRQDPADPVRWAPREVWSSCDGTLSFSYGIFQETDGTVGTYATAWELGPGGDYAWTYDLGAPDDPQPVRPADVEVDENTILVSELDAIEGRVADCPDEGGLPAAPPARAAADAEHALTRSEDGTLQYWWEHRADGTRRVVVEYLRDGSWQQPLDFIVPGGEG